MYNGKIINDLLKQNRLKPKDLLNHLGVKDNGTVQRFTASDIKASRLEQIADFFGVSMDTFFLREGTFSNTGVVVMGDSNTTDYITSTAPSDRAKEALVRCRSLERELKAKDEIIAEKEKNIKLLEEMVALLKTQKQ